MINHFLFLGFNELMGRIYGELQDFKVLKNLY